MRGNMRVRILRQSSGIIEGVSLSALHPGVMYDVSEPVATFLVTTGAAFFMASDQPAVVVPLGNPHLTDEQLFGGVTVLQRDKAADRPPRRKRR